MREIPEADLLILGSGSYETDLRKLARRLGVSDRVTIKHLAPADRQGMATTLALEDAASLPPCRTMRRTQWRSWRPAALGVRS